MAAPAAAAAGRPPAGIVTPDAVVHQTWTRRNSKHLSVDDLLQRDETVEMRCDFRYGSIVVTNRRIVAKRYPYSFMYFAFFRNTSWIVSAHERAKVSAIYFGKYFGGFRRRAALVIADDSSDAGLPIRASERARAVEFMIAASAALGRA